MRVNKTAVFEKMGYKPHEGQQRVHSSDSRFRVLACGARWGKTTGGAMEGVSAMLEPNSIGWVVGDTYDISGRVFNFILQSWRLKRPDMIRSASESAQVLTLRNGATVQGKSADHPESLLGAGLNWMVVDEPALLKEDVWAIYLRSRLTDKNGWALFTGTPKGRNWYWRMYQLGKTGQYPDYWSTEGPVWENPIIDKAKLLKEKADGLWLQKAWDQEVLGLFVEDSGEVFKDIRNPKRRFWAEWNSETCVIEEPIKGASYVLGADLAKYQDWTVISILDMQGRLVYWERLPQGMPYPSQRARIISASKRYNDATCYIDSSGVGDPVVDEMRIAGAPVIGVKTAQEKTSLIDNLVLGFDNDRIRYANIPILLNELEIFGMSRTADGRVKYQAPQEAGLHDDAVISLALAWRGVGFGMLPDFDKPLDMSPPRRGLFDMPDLSLSM